MFGRGKSKRVRFHCACGQSLTATLRLLSRPFPCPKCGRALHTPRVQKAAGGWAVRFDCPLCHARTSAPISRHGAKVPCGHCRREVAVPEVFEGDRPGPATAKAGEELPIYAQPTMDLPAVGAAPAPEPVPEPPAESAPAAPLPEGRTALLKRVMSEEADRLQESHARIATHPSALAKVSPWVWAATGGAALLLIAGFLPWLAAGGKTASFLGVVTESPWRDALPNPVACAAFYYAWIALVLAAAWLCRDPGWRGTFLWALFLAAVTGAAVARTFLAELEPGAPRAGFYLAGLGALLVAVVGAVTLWNSIARLGLSLLLTLLAAVAVAGSFTDWFGLARERIAIKAVVAYEDHPDTGYSRAAISIVVRNQSREPILLDDPAASNKAAGERLFLTTFDRQGAGAWTRALERERIIPPTRIEPGREAEIKLALYPVWDLTLPGSDTLSPKPDTLAGQYRVRLESGGRVILRPFDITGVPHPEVDAAALFAKGQAAEKAGRPGEADEHYEVIAKKYPKTAFGPKAVAARQGIGGAARDERETRQINAAVADLRKLEDERAVAVKNRPPDRDDGRVVPGLDKMDADIQILTTRIKEARQDLCRRLADKAERATLEGRYEEALRAVALLADQKPEGQHAQRGEALRADVIRRAADAATRDGIAQVNAALAADQLVTAWVTAQTLRRGGVRDAAGSNDVRLAAEALYQRKCDEVGARLRELPCGKRARLYESFLESRSDLAADLRAELALEMKNCRSREEKAKDLVARIEPLRANTGPWYEAVKALLDGYADTDAAAPYLSRRASVEAWARERPK
jgi:hypothetical protein